MKSSDVGLHTSAESGTDAGSADREKKLRFNTFVEDLRLLLGKHDLALLHRPDGIAVVPILDPETTLGGLLYIYAGRVGYFYPAQPKLPDWFAERAARESGLRSALPNLPIPAERKKAKI